MLIGSQDKEKIINLSNIGYVEIEPNFYEGERYYINTNFPERKIAEYSSEEKAIEESEWDCFDCPECGCQIIASERMPKAEVLE